MSSLLTRVEHGFLIILTLTKERWSSLPHLLQGFAAWRAYARHRASLRKALAHLRYNSASKAFASWHACAVELAQHTRQLSGAALFWSHHTQAAAFRAWVQRFTVKQNQRRMVRL